MTSREKILQTIARNKPEVTPMPQHHWDSKNDNLIDDFASMLEKIGATAFRTTDFRSLKNSLIETSSEAKVIANGIPSVDWQRSINLNSVEPHNLATVDLALIEGELGVAENGAIWISETNLRHRVLPFICQHLVIAIQVSKIVATMHDAYQQIDLTSSGFGTFIAGPSKTADIEQSMVIGAHGARSLFVYLIESRT